MEYEDIEDMRAFEQALKEYKTGDTIPGEIVDAIIDGETPVRVWRLYGKLALVSLAERAGISASYLSQIENGKKPGTLDVYRRLAVVLDVEPEDLSIEVGCET